MCNRQRETRVDREERRKFYIQVHKKNPQRKNHQTLLNKRANALPQPPLRLPGTMSKSRMILILWHRLRLVNMRRPTPMAPLHIPPDQPLILNGSQCGRRAVKPRITIGRRAHLLMVRGGGHPVSVIMPVI